MMIMTIGFYFWIYLGFKKQFKKLNDDEYIKNKIKNKTWMGKPITTALSKRMTFIGSIVATITTIATIIILILKGTNKAWAITTAFSLIFIYGLYVWSTIKIRQSKAKISKRNILISKIITKLGVGIFMAIVIGVSVFRDLAMSSPYFQIWIIGFVSFIIIFSEIEYALSTR